MNAVMTAAAEIKRKDVLIMLEEAGCHRSEVQHLLQVRDPGLGMHEVKLQAVHGGVRLVSDHVMCMSAILLSFFTVARMP